MLLSFWCGATAAHERIISFVLLNKRVSILSANKHDEREKVTEEKEKPGDRVSLEHDG